MALAITLFVLFGYRYAIRNRTKFMPNGMLAVVSVVVLPGHDRGDRLERDAGAGDAGALTAQT